MLFSKLSAAILGLATFASASPLPYNALAVREPSAFERGLVWTPRSLEARGEKKNKKNDIVIAQNINIQLTQIQIIQEVQIVNVIQNIIVIDGKDDAKDNVRKNHYKNKNRNKDVNIVVIVVVVVVDARGGNNNLRYVTRQVESNPEIESKEYVVVTEASTLTVDNQGPAGAAGPTAVAPTEAFATSAVPSIAAWDPAAAPQLSKDQLLLPADAGAPSWEGAKQEEDPAIIVEVDQAVFVAFVDGDGDKYGDDKYGDEYGDDKYGDDEYGDEYGYDNDDKNGKGKDGRD